MEFELDGRGSFAPEGDPVAEDSDGLEEIEHEGQFYRIPKVLRDRVLQSVDHERQLAELMEHKGKLDQGRRSLAEREALAESTMQIRLHLAAFDAQIESFQGVDWEAYANESPEDAQALWQEFQGFLEARQHYVAALQEENGRAQRAAEQELAARMAETGQTLTKEIEAWSPEVAGKLVEYAAAFGVTIDELREVADARLWKILHRAYAGDQLHEQQKAAKSAAQMQAVRPAAQVSGAGSGLGAARDELGTAEWMRRRNEQMRRLA
jgi:hypothetical protein